MNDSMHVVAKIWYRLFWACTLVFCLAVVGGCLAARFNVAPVADQAANFALRMPTLVFAGLSLFYCLTAYFVVDKRDAPMATFGSSLLLTLVLLDGLAFSSGLTGGWAYVGMWLLSAFFIGM